MICPNGLNKTYLVSLPRSGHHLLVRGLTEAMNHKLVYSEYYNSAHNMQNCDHVNLQKSHDFDLDLEINPEFKYIVLVRDDRQSMLSWMAADKTIDIETFAKSKAAYYEGFRNKWIVGRINTMVIEYEDFVLFKSRMVENCCLFMGIEPNMDKLNEWLVRENRAINS